MWRYYLFLGWRSLWKTPVISVLMMLALGLGMSFSLVVLTLFDSTRHNPMQHKIDSLFAVQLDNWSDDPAKIFVWSKNFVPTALNFRDAKAVLASDIPVRKTVLSASGAMLDNPSQPEKSPGLQSGYLVSRDFFAMFDVKFADGGAWEPQGIYTGIHEIVLSEWMSESYFEDADSVGKLLLVDGTPYTVAGVVSSDWYMAPRVYDPAKNPFGTSPAFYLPAEDIALYNYERWGSVFSWNNDISDSHQDFIDGETLWLQAWVEFKKPEQKAQYLAYLKGYIEQQQENGRYKRSNKVFLNNSQKWMSVLAGYQSYGELILAGLILLICTTNSIALLMAKFLRTSLDSAVRRALGASRFALFTQHMFEAFLVAVGGGIIALLISFYWFEVINKTMSGWDWHYFAEFAQLQASSIVFLFALVLLATTLSGALPAWRVSGTNPSRYLNTE